MNKTLWAATLMCLCACSPQPADLIVATGQDAGDSSQNALEGYPVELQNHCLLPKIQLPVYAQQRYPDHPSEAMYAVCLVSPGAALYLAILNGSTDIVGEGWTYTGYGNGLIPATVSGEAVQKCADALTMLPMPGSPGPMCGSGGSDGGLDSSEADTDGSGGSGGCTLEVAAGYSHTCALKSDGTAWCWGQRGGLGHGADQDQECIDSAFCQPTPMQVTDLGTDVVGVAAGMWMSCARKSDGTLWCWGTNNYGGIGDGTLTPRDFPVQVATLGTGVVQVAVDGRVSCARKSDGTLWCWGVNENGGVGDGTTGGESCSGVQCRPTPVQVASLGTQVVEVATGGDHTCAVLSDGTLWCWGSNRVCELGSVAPSSAPNPSPLQVTALGANVSRVAAGAEHTCAIKKDGTLWCWGLNLHGENGDGTANNLPQDGGDPCSPTPVQVTALGTEVVEVAAGYGFTCARKSDNTLWCWGDNTIGEVPTAPVTSTNPWPLQVTELGANVISITAGGRHACARKGDGTLWCWGQSLFGEIGNGKIDPRSPPTQPAIPCP